MENVFEPLKFFDELKAADASDKQAGARAEAMRNAFAAYDASRMKELATKGGLHKVEFLHKVELQLEREIEMTRNEIKSTELRIIKWVVGTIITQTVLIIAVIGIAVAILLK